MKRNFGFPSETSRPMLGNETSGVLPLHSAYTTRADNVIRLADHFPPGQSNSERLTVAPSFIREFAACVFIGLVVLTPAIFVTVTVVLYALLVAQPTEY